MRKFILFVVILGLLSPLATWTAAAGPASDCSIAIPDLGANLTNQIPVASSVVINDVNVVLNITHSWVSDLVLQLSSPGGTTITLVNQAGGSSDFIVTTLDDQSAGGSVQSANPITGPSYTPFQALSDFNGQNAYGIWTLTISDVVAQDSGNLNNWSLLINGTSYTCLAPGTLIVLDPPADAAAAVNPDMDGDGVDNAVDNCANAYNPGQEDGWGSAMGDACDTDWYNMSGIGVSGFEQKDGSYNVHGNCYVMEDGAVRCPVIASFDPAAFDPAAMPMTMTSSEAGSWSVVVHYLHSNNGADVYQVNVYRTNPPQPDTLVDDRLEIHVYGALWQWFQRGGDPQYGGLIEGGMVAGGESK